MKYRLGDISNINIKNLKKSDTLKKIQYLDTTNLTENKIDNLIEINLEIEKVPSRAKRKVSHNDILISTVRPNQKHYGIIKNPAENLIVSTGFTVITVKEELVDPDFLFAQLTTSTITDYLQQIAENSTSTYPAIKAKDLEVLEINLPELEVQKKIGELSSLLEKKIELNNQMIDTLEEMASALFKRWFVDFEFPDENGNPYKSSGGKMVDSELGEIPEGWGVESLSEIAHYKNGLAMQKFRPLDNEESLPVLKIKELNQGYTDKNSDRCSMNISEDVKIKDGDIVFSWSGTLIVGIWTGGEAGLNQHLFKVTSNRFSKWFYFLWTKFYLNRFINIAKDKATTMGHIKRQHLNESLVCIPKEIRKYNEIFEPIINELENLGKNKKQLELLRDTLLPKLLSGEIEV